MGVPGGTGARRGASKATAVNDPSLGAPTSPRSSAGPAQPRLGETTAEIPAVRPRAAWAAATAHERAQHVVLPDGSLWYPGSDKRLPAPFGLRLFVWVLVFLVIVTGAGLAVERVHPSWLDALRNSPSGAVVVSGSSGAASPGTTNSSAVSGGFRLLSNSATGATYATGARTYSIVIRFSQRVWTVVTSPAHSHTYLIEQVLAPAASPKQVLINGTASVTLSAATQSISVVVNGKTVGTIASPQVEHTYSFRPSAR